MGLAPLWAVARKDIIIELRSKEMLTPMFIFGFLVVVIFNFAFEPGSPAAREAVPGILWVAITFAGILGLSRSFVLEKEEDCLQGLRLCPADRGFIFLGKFLANLAFILIMEAIIVPLFMVLFNLPLLSVAPALAQVMVLGTIGYAAVGTLFSAISIHTRAREVMLPIMLFPIVVPVIIGAIKSTGIILRGQSLADLAPWLKLLLAFDVIFLVICFLLFEFVLEEQ